MDRLPRAYRRPLAEGKQRVQRKLRNIEDEKADIIKLINAYTAKVERVAKTLLHADRECFFSFYHAVNRELEECLDKLFLIKAQLLENEETGEILKDSGLVLEEKDSGGAAGGELAPYLPGEEEELSRCSSISKLCQSITSSMMLHDNKDFAGQSTSERNLTPHRDGSSRSDATVAATKGPSYPPSHHVTGNARSNSMMDTEPFDLSHVLHKWQNCDLQQNGVRRNSKAYSDGEDSRSELRHHTVHAQRQQQPGGMSTVSLETSRIGGAPHSSTCSPAESARQLNEFLDFSARGPSSMPPLHSSRLTNKLSDRHLEEACLAHKSQDMALSAMEMKVREIQFWPKKDPLDSLAENHLPPPPPAPAESQNAASWISPPWTTGNRSREHTPPSAIKLSETKQQNHANLVRVSPVREIPDQVVLSARLSPPPQRAYQEVCPPGDFRPIVPPVDYDTYPEHYGASVVCEIPPPLLKLGVVTPVTVTHIIKPSDFWLRVLSEDGKKLSEQLQLAYGSRHDRENLRVEVGLYYCAPYGKDNVWHRVKVLGIHQAENSGGVTDVHVLFVDYGNTDMIPITHLKSLDLAFTSWPLQAVHCCLNGLGIERQTWTSYEMAQFQQLVTSTQLSAMFHELRPDGIYPVDLWSNISYGDEVLQESIVRLLSSSHSSVAPPPGMIATINLPELGHVEQKESPDETSEVLTRNIVKEDSSEDENLEYYSDTSDTYVELNDYNVAVPPPIVKPSDGYLLGIVSSVIDPSEIYIHLITPNSNQLDDLREQMTNYYNSESNRDLLHLSAMQKGSFWACRYSVDNFWYRARVIDLPEERINIKSKVVIQYIDFGNKEEMTVKDLRPLTAEFAKTPAFAFRCSLAYLKPKENDDSEGSGWSQRVGERLAQLIDCEKCVTAQPVSDFESCDLWDTSIDVLLWDTEDSKDVLLNKVLVKEGLCDTEMSEWLEDEVQKDEEGEEEEGVREIEVTVQSSDVGLFVKEGDGNFGLKFNLKDRLSPLADMDALLDNWNPLEEDYVSDRNSLEVDIDDPSVATLGYKLEGDSKVCHYYSIRMYCPKGDNCPFLHVYNGKGIPAAKKEDVISGATLKLPKPGGLFLVTVTAVNNPGHFYVIFPYGFFRLEDLFRSEDNSAPPPSKDQVDLKKLIHAMGKHYSKVSAREGTSISPAVGSLVAARNTLGDGSWFRGRVTDIIEMDDSFKVHIFCVDTGQKHWVPRKDVFKIQPEFLHVPFQAVECFLANVEPKGSETGGVWSKEAKETFLDMVSGKNMVARVRNKDRKALYIDLVDIDQQQEFSVNGHLVTMGFAQFSKSMTCVPPPQDSKDDEK